MVEKHNHENVIKHLILIAKLHTPRTLNNYVNDNIRQVNLMLTIANSNKATPEDFFCCLAQT